MRAGNWTHLELSYALDKGPAAHIVPVLLAGGDFERLGQLSPLLRPHYQGVDFSRHGFEPAAFDSLVKRVERARLANGEEQPRSWRPPAGLIQGRFAKLRDRFLGSLRPHLAGGELIRRQETAEISRLLDDPTVRIVVVHGVAGSGKSGALLELVEDFVERGIAFLPLRLDRFDLSGSPGAFASRELNLPATPASCLETIADPKGILVLDQLDALRWTGSH